MTRDSVLECASPLALFERSIRAGNFPRGFAEMGYARANYKSVPMKNLSIRNQLGGTVQQIVRGPVVCEVIVNTAAGTLASVITTRSVRDLNLKKGDKVFVMIKATEVSIQKNMTVH